MQKSGWLAKEDKLRSMSEGADGGDNGYCSDRPAANAAACVVGERASDREGRVNIAAWRSAFEREYRIVVAPQSVLHDSRMIE